MFTRLNEIQISLGRALFINFAILGIAFYSGVFWTKSNSHEIELIEAKTEWATKLEEARKETVVVDKRLNKKIEIINKQQAEINGLQIDVAVLKSKIID